MLFFFFQARVKVDPDGNGAHIYAYTYKILKGKESGQFLHDFLWYAIIYFEDKMNIMHHHIYQSFTS